MTQGWDGIKAADVMLKLRDALGDKWQMGIATWHGEAWMGNVVHVVTGLVEMRVHSGAVTNAPTYWTRVYMPVLGDITRGTLYDALITVRGEVQGRLRTAKNDSERAEAIATLTTVNASIERVENLRREGKLHI